MATSAMQKAYTKAGIPQKAIARNAPKRSAAWSASFSQASTRRAASAVR